MFRRVELRAAASAVLLIVLCPAAPRAYGDSPTCVAEEAKLVASDPEAGDNVGWEVAVFGDTVVVGVPHDDHSGLTWAGSVLVFVRSGSGWSEEAQLHASDAEAGDEFGTGVALSGDTLIIGAGSDDHSALTGPGSAYVFVRSGASWSEQAKLTASVPTNSAWFGSSVALDGNTAVVCARGASEGKGAAYVFVRDGTTWSQQKKLIASDGGVGFGASVALAGDTALVGADYDTHGGNSQAGSAYVFVRSGIHWTEQAKLIASDSEPWDYFGRSVDLEGNTALIGAEGGDNLGLGKYAGAAYVFVRSGSTWTEEAKLTPGFSEFGDHFGRSVSLSQDRALIGAYGVKIHTPPSMNNAGSAYVFTRLGTSWSEGGQLFASDPEGGAYFGYAVGLWNDTAAVGAFVDGAEDEGAAYVLGLSAAFGASKYCTAGTSASGCQVSLYACGNPSASAASGFDLQASAGEGDKDGLFFFGTNGRQANSWGNGSSFQCVVPPVIRTGTLPGTGTSGACNSSYSQDLNAHWCPSCPKPATNPGAGAVVQAQLWYRDPLSTSNQTTSLSDAIEFVVAPR
jgi:hypothetical protein